MFDTDYRLVSGIAIIYHQYFSFLTLAFGFAPTLSPYIENPAAVHASIIIEYVTVFAYAVEIERL